jgi:hypothetical protein
VTSWADAAASAPDVVRHAEAALAARRMKCLATLRRDGSVRLSETSGVIVAAGDLWLGMIPSAKQRDLANDRRVSVHCGSPTDEWATSVRISGSAFEAMDGDRARFVEATGRDVAGFELYRLEVTEVVVTRPHPETDEILVEWWTPARGEASATRRPG